MKVLSGFVCLSAAHGLIHHQASEELVTQTMHTTEKWKRECGSTKVKHSFAFAQAHNPGAGMNPKAVKPFKSVYKDGFLLVACVKDSMYVHGDKFGNNKYDYKIGPTANSSIVHYNEHVAKEDGEKMTHAVCFEFCRGIEDMGYFGISNGRDCYCTPYFKPMASDSSECDAVCEGDNTLMCGGPKKNSIFGMHSCADTESDLSTAKEDATEAGKSLKELAKNTIKAADDGEADAGKWQKALGGAGDPDGSAMMQKAKIFAGKCRDEANDASDDAKAVTDATNGIDGVSGPFTDYDNAKKAEDAIKAAKAATAKAEDTLEALQATADKLTPQVDEDRAKGSAKQYYPVMYFVDKEFEDAPSTCSGDLAADPIMTVSMDECAAACDALPGKCVGISYYQDASSLCFLISKFKNVQYWTGCAPSKSGLLLQKRKGSKIATCSAKLQVYEGTTLKPDPKGKCKQCLKEATKADRCYE